MQNLSFNDEPLLSQGSVQSEINLTPGGSQAGLRENSAKKNSARDLVVEVRRNFARELWDWARCKRVAPTSVNQLTESMAALDSSARFGADNTGESPIFLLATGWRSGSTLLQRILITDPSVLLWGEPLGEMTLVSEIAGMLARLSTFPRLKELCAGNYPPFSSLSTSWIASLYPPGNDFRVGLQTLLTRWLGEPAQRRGFGRWGFKEVRMGAAEATLLHWLYPKAKFVLLSRNPYDCYRSLADSGWHHIYHARPDIRIDSAAGLARHWNRIALSWSELPADFPAFRVRYEDLIGGKVDFRKLEAWLGVQLNERTALSAFVGSTTRRHRLGLCQRWIVSREAAAGMRALGYSQ
jgi:Sulfotransferase family